MSTIAPLTEAEVKQLVEDWYRGLDVHAPTVEMLPLLAEEGLEMRFPEATVRGLAEFDRWYNGVLRIFFDEIHTLKKLEVALSADKTQAEIKLVVLWEASRWKAPAAQSERLKMDAAQTWVVRQSPKSGSPVIVTYIVDSLDPLPGSVPL
jgi:hypothetical protein